jgi:hypothetical protein
MPKSKIIFIEKIIFTLLKVSRAANVFFFLRFKQGISLKSKLISSRLFFFQWGGDLSMVIRVLYRRIGCLICLMGLLGVGGFFDLGENAYASVIDRHKSLLVTSPQALYSEASLEEWSFGAVFRELVKSYYKVHEPTPVMFDQLARQWLEGLGKQRPGIRRSLTCLWATGKAEESPGCDRELLDPAYAPFKLLALNYRPDFVKDSCDEKGPFGEFRLTYGLTSLRPEGTHPLDLPGQEMTVIFEYDLGLATSKLRSLSSPLSGSFIYPWQWAQRWQRLSDFEGKQYLDELRILVSQVIRTSANFETALGQLRINEVVGDPRFEPQVSQLLRDVGVLFAGCYRLLLEHSDDPSGGVLACRDWLDFSRLPQPIGGTFTRLAKLLNVIALLMKSPLPLPVPRPIVGEFFDIVGSLSDQFFANWVMSEWVLRPQGFHARAAKDTPDFHYNGSQELSALLVSLEEPILRGQVDLNKELAQAGIRRDFAPRANPLDPWRWNGAPMWSQDIARGHILKAKFAQLTCNGCHGTQTVISALPSMLREILLNSPRISELQQTASLLLQKERDHTLHFENIDGFYMISPLKAIGTQGLDHLALELLRPQGALDQRHQMMTYLLEDGARRCPL